MKFPISSGRKSKLVFQTQGINKIQEHVKEIWERINRLEQKPSLEKSHMWDTFTGRGFMLIGTAIGTAILTHIPAILKLLLEAK